MRMPFGKYKNVDIAFINSGYLSWLLDQKWFLDREDDLVVAVDREWEWREKTGQHFSDHKVKV